MTLTSRQRRIVRFLARREGNDAPTYREIGAAAGLSSPSSVFNQLRHLRDMQILTEGVPHSGRCTALAPWMVLIGDDIYRAEAPRLLPLCERCEEHQPEGHRCEADLKTSLEWTTPTKEASP